MEIRFASGVLEEVEESARYYEAEVEGLGKSFLSQLGDAITEVKSRPTLYRKIEGPYRRHLLNEGSVIYVLAVMHLKRAPGYWRGRES